MRRGRRKPRRFELLGVDVHGGARGRRILDGSRDGNGPALGLCSEGQELGEHELARGAGEFVDIGGGEALGGNRIQNCKRLSVSKGTQVLPSLSVGAR